MAFTVEVVVVEMRREAAKVRRHAFVCCMFNVATNFELTTMSLGGNEPHYLRENQTKES